MIPCISYISFTTDFWSSNSSDQFLSLTGHCTFDNFDVQVVVLYAQPFTERHTGVNSRRSSPKYFQWNGLLSRRYCIVCLSSISLSD